MKKLRGTVRRVLLTDTYNRSLRKPVLERHILYESFFGNGILCNPEAIFRHLLQDQEFEAYKHIWVLDDFGKHPHILKEFRGVRNVKFVERGSLDYHKYLARCKHLINNVTFPEYFVKRKDQIYLNTWHGVPIKKMGYDRPNGPVVSRNILRNFLQADYLLSTNEYMTDTMYRHAYKLDGVFRNKILETGSPRMDYQFEHAESSLTGVSDLSQRLHLHGVTFDSSKKVLLFAPTWRGNFGAPKVNSDYLRNIADKLATCIDLSEWQILFKIHQVEFKALAEDDSIRELVVPNDIPTNILLASTDALISDYSSILFDFLVSGKPIFYYIPDKVSYYQSIGLYFSHDELPGYVSENLDELVEHLDKFLEFSFRNEDSNFSQASLRFVPWEDGYATKKIVDYVFRGVADSTNFRVRTIGSDKTRVLLYGGALLSNGVTSSLYNLLQQIDYEKFDVTLLAPNASRLDRLVGLPDELRIYVYLGKYLKYLGKSTLARRDFRRRLNSGDFKPKPTDYEFFQHDWRRTFGDTQFDHIADFSGYGPYWANFFALGESKAKSIWMHNDLYNEYSLYLQGKREGAKHLKSVFNTYDKFDVLVSVSDELSSINRKNLGNVTGVEKFVFAKNLLAMERIQKYSARKSLSVDALPSDQSGGVALDDILRLLMSAMELSELEMVVKKRLKVLSTIPDWSESFVFITAGRLSAEKNHQLLIEAFRLISKDFHNAKLVILGDGVLHDELKLQIDLSGLTPKVFLLGHIENPFDLISQADCFVMSSMHEGQPMVLLEAQALGVPIVTTNFSSVSGALDSGGGLIVEQDPQSLAEGMRRAIAGKVPQSQFDADNYNSEALDQVQTIFTMST